MNKVITVNLNGNGYQLEEGGYDALRSYLERARANLADNPDRDEIVSDIEHAIAERFRSLLGAYKSVVSEKEIREVLNAIGPVDGGSEATPPGQPEQSRTMPPPPPPFAGNSAFGSTSSSTNATGASTSAGNPTGTSSATGSAGSCAPRRLYRFNDGAIFAGVCRGLGIYFDLDVTLVRLVFVVVSALSLGLGLVAYFVMAFSVPLAETPEEKAAAQGGTPTAQDFIRRAKEGYYDAMKNFPDKDQRKAGKKRFNRDVHAWAENFKTQAQGNASQWSRNWQSHWTPPFQPHPAAWVAIPLLSILSVALVILCIAMTISILKTGAIFGLALPGGLPVWLTILIIFALFQMVEWPIKAARYQLWAQGHPDHGHYYPRSFFGGGFIWLAIFVSIAWFVYPHQTQNVIQHLPPLIHEATDKIVAWWNQK